jgi:hypothetical protein
MSQKYVGLTLLFAVTKTGSVEGRLNSYIAPYRARQSAREEVTAAAAEIGARQVAATRDREKVEYLGIEDVFCVVGPIGHGMLLGRSTLWDHHDPRAMTKLLRAPSDYSLHRRPARQGTLYMASLLYFHDDLRDEADSYGVACLALIEAQVRSAVPGLADAVANSQSFLRSISRCDALSLDADALQYVGIEDIEVLAEDPRRGGAFQRLSREVASVDELHEMLASREDIEGFFEASTCL